MCLHGFEWTLICMRASRLILINASIISSKLSEIEFLAEVMTIECIEYAGSGYATSGAYYLFYNLRIIVFNNRWLSR